VKTESIRVLIVDDHAIVREGLKAVLQTDGSLQIVGEAANGRQAIEAVKSLKPQVVLVDLIMPLMDGIEATKEILRQFPSVHVLVLSSYPEKDLVERALAAGATGYLLKHSASGEVVRAIHQVHKGSAYFSAPISKMLIALGELLPSNKVVPPHVRLTPRQCEVLRLIAEGQCNKQIADTMDISIKTVEKHRQELMLRLDIHTIAGLTRYALAKGLVKNDSPTKEVELATNAIADILPAVPARGRDRERVGSVNAPRPRVAP
jgi:DNA-binding NarL/FixJ family response regulator